MAGKGEKKKPKSLDDVLAEFQEQHSKNLDESFKVHDAFMKEENQNHLYNHIFSPGQDSLYNSIKSELDKAFKGDDEAKIHGKKEDIKKAVTKGLKKYFETVQPSLTKVMDDLKMDEGEQYDYLTSMYDDHVGAGKIKGVNSIKGIEELLKNKKMTVGHIKRHLYDQKTKHIEGALQLLQSKHVTHHFARYHPAQIAGYLRPQLEKAGFEVEDKVGYASADLGELLGLRRGIIEKEGHPYLKKKEEKKK